MEPPVWFVQRVIQWVTYSLDSIVDVQFRARTDHRPGRKSRTRRCSRSYVTAFQTENRDHQLDLAYVPRALDYKLWDDGALPLEDRNEIISDISGELFHLKNSVDKYRPREECGAIRF